MIKNHRGVGLSLHLDQLNPIIESEHKLPYLEVIADNWLSPGPQHQKLERLRQDNELLFHCVNSNIGGTDSLDLDYLKSIKQLAKTFEVQHLSDHLCLQAHDGVYFHDLLPIPFSEESLENCVSRVLEVQEVLGQEIILENLSYYIQYKESSYSEAEFLNEIARRTSCGILLDLNNIWVNEQNLGITCNEFLEQLDMQHVREIHLAGPDRMEDGTYVDTHGSSVTSTVIKMLKDLPIKEGTPIIYERDTNIPDLAELLKEVTDISKFLESHATK